MSTQFEKLRAAVLFGISAVVLSVKLSIGDREALMWITHTRRGGFDVVLEAVMIGGCMDFMRTYGCIFFFRVPMRSPLSICFRALLSTCRRC